MDTSDPEAYMREQVPMDKPEASLKLISAFIRGQNLSTQESTLPGVAANGLEDLISRA